MEFKTYEQKCLYELDRLENENAELKDELSLAKDTIAQLTKDNDKLAEACRTILKALDIRLRTAYGVDNAAAIDANNTIYSWETELFQSLLDNLSLLGFELERKDEEDIKDPNTD